LERRASTRDVVTYTDFAKEVGAPPVNNFWPNHPLCPVFGDFDREDAERGLPFRTALVFSQVLGRLGDGFFKILSDLRGIDTSADKRDEIWSKELSALAAHYGSES
jgi:hypothetical protein